MEYIMQCVRAIVIYTLSATFCIQLLPKNHYAQYVRFTVGLVYIIMIINLIQSILGMQLI